MSPATTKAPRERLTLRDTIDLEIAIDNWIDEHVDEIELNGGALPDDFAQLLDEVLGAQKNRVDAIAAKLDELSGKALTAKATKDRAARRQKVWENVAAAIKAYAQRELERRGVTRLEGAAAVLRLQRNSAPAVIVAVSDQELLAAADGDERFAPLARFITVERVATIDRKAIAAAYEARRIDLEAETSLLALTDLTQEEIVRIGATEDPHAEAGRVLADMRAKYIADNLAAEFPGITCTRGSHLRVD